MAMTVLVLGGTSEARALAGELALNAELRVISSLAGRVSNPALPAGEVRVDPGTGSQRSVAFAAVSRTCCTDAAWASVGMVPGLWVPGCPRKSRRWRRA